MRIAVCALALMFLVSCGDERRDEPPPVPVSNVQKQVRRLNYTLVSKHPHDKTAFTEGLLYYNGKLLESTGSPDNLPETRSMIGEVDLSTGKISVKAELDRKQYFGEGIVVLNDKLYQVTWRSQRGFIYDAKSYKQIGQFSYPNYEGWGLTTDGKHIIMSDGTYNLTWFEPGEFKTVKTVGVTRNGYGLDHLNELEWINGYIFANVWMTNTIVKIDPETGVVVAEGDFTPYYNEALKEHPKILEMNGIAFDAGTGNVLLTGKMWPSYFEIKLSE